MSQGEPTQDKLAPGRLTGKVAWIVEAVPGIPAAGSGIGLAAAKGLAAAGATVVLSGRPLAPLRRAAAAIAATGGRAAAVTGDLADAATASTLAARIVERLGRLDILVAHAGMRPLRRDGGPEAAEEALRAFGHGSRAVQPVMRRQRSGLLIRVAALTGRAPRVLDGSAYAALRRAMLAGCAALNAEEGVNGLRASCICPGEVAAPPLGKGSEPVLPLERARMLQPEDVANAVVWLACLPPHVCVAEMTMTPTWSRGEVPAPRRQNAGPLHA